MRFVLLILHISGGSIGLLSGTVAMAAGKGGRLHRLSGNVFTIAMLGLAASGLALAILKSQRGNMIGSVVTFYMISTAWRAGRSRVTGLLDWVGLLFGMGGAVAATAGGLLSLHEAIPDRSAPAGMSFFFGSVLMLAAMGDLRMLVRGGSVGRQRILRHLWRMCFGLFIATGSFFLGQQQVFPAFLRGSAGLTVIAVLPLLLMVYWLVRVRFGKGYLRQPSSGLAQVVP